MSEPQVSRTVRPFQKIVRETVAPDSDARMVVPFEKNTYDDNIDKIAEETETPDPKEESVQGSAPSSASPTSGEPNESETTAPAPASKDTGKPKENESSQQSSSSQTNPGWTEPPVPGKLQTSESTPTPPTPGSQKKDNPPTSAK